MHSDASSPKVKALRHKLSNVVHIVKCSEDCPALYIGESKQPISEALPILEEPALKDRSQLFICTCKRKGTLTRTQTFVF